MAKAGDTVRFKASFYNFSGALADPTNVTVNVYAHSNRALLNTGSAIKMDTGIYYYDYTLPSDTTGSVVYEFVGTLDGKPTIARELMIVEWV